jgi:hypothetical protein
MWRQPDKSEESVSDPDYYLKKFKPIWGKYKLIWWICGAIVVLDFLLIYVFRPNSIYLLYGTLIITLIGIIIFLYFIFKLRCPKCGLQLYREIVPLLWPLTGECDRCGTRLKNRLVSNNTAKMIRIAYFPFIIALIWGFIYFILHR